MELVDGVWRAATNAAVDGARLLATDSLDSESTTGALEPVDAA